MTRAIACDCCRRPPGWRLLLASLLALSHACSTAGPTRDVARPPADSSVDENRPDEPSLSEPTPLPESTDETSVAHVPDAPVPTVATQATPEVPPTAPEGRDFIDEINLLYRTVACAGEQPVPDHLDARVIDNHCRRLERRKARYRKRYLKDALPFLMALHPPDLPDVLVYPFAGGDLISALVAFPEAREITTLSLEHAGDPRRIQDIGKSKLSHSLSGISRRIGGLLSSGSNTSKNLSAAHKIHLPAQLSSFLIGLAVHDQVPVSARFFSLRDDGSIRYLDDADIQTLEKQRANRLKYDWEDADFSIAFSNIELHFRQRGAGAEAPVRIHRHIAANLDDKHLAKNPAVLRHLQAKGKVTILTKGASYLLWRDSFSRIRDYMLAHLAWMLSDSTGIPPRFARQASMKQTTLGRFRGSLLEADDQHNDDFRALWRSQPKRRLPFRFGYVDNHSNAHLLITAPAPGP